jgi:60 kDa SS-A/Ro ribonucleoprotein
MASNHYTQFAVSQNPAKAVTPQTQAIPGREAEMARNNAGGVTFTLDKWSTLDRFLMIGSEGGNYYVGQNDVTKQSFANLKACIAEDGKRVVNRLMEYSLGGRAPKNDPAIVALAVTAVYGNQEVVEAAYAALPRVCRTGTHLFLFVSILDSLGKWNAAAKRGVAKWYTARDIEKLTVQLLKYQQRNGWAHRDVLRLAHVKPTSELQSAVFRYVVKGELEQGTIVPQTLIDFEYLKRSTNKQEVLRLVEGNSVLTWEMVPTQFLKDADVLTALVKNMGLTAVIRKLGALTTHGVIAPLSEGSKLVISKLSDTEALKAQRVHPITILQAIKQYSKGAGERGSMSWTPDQRVVDALNDTFYASFGAVEKTNDNYFMGVDCSGSMFGAAVNGSPNLTAADVAGVMAMAIVRNQPNYWIGGFNHKMSELKISPSMRLDKVLDVIRRFNWGSTDCSLPYLTASEMKMNVDRFVTITDNETYAGRVQPAQALRDYRARFNKGAKGVVIGTSVSNFTIADPKDSGMLDIAGFDSAAPQIIATF